MLVNTTTPFNEITRSLRFFKVPNIVIFTLDITIKYIALLGEICSAMLTALKIRSIGKNKNKRGAFSGILGTVFVKANNACDETSKAMTCRGFSGNYNSKTKLKFSLLDAVYILALIALVALFFYLEKLL
jgi:cobalt/nickel transport system permease protein